eukprot:SAG31_NODE_29425_length_395_cov_1.287162_1_plen_33_part_01
MLSTKFSTTAVGYCMPPLCERFPEVAYINKMYY